MLSDDDRGDDGVDGAAIVPNDVQCHRTMLFVERVLLCVSAICRNIHGARFCRLSCVCYSAYGLYGVLFLLFLCVVVFVLFLLFYTKDKLHEVNILICLFNSPNFLKTNKRD